MWRWAIVLACCAITALAFYTTLSNISGRDVCGTIDRNATALRELVMDSARESKRFGTIRLGNDVSTYQDRLAQARRQAKKIGGCP